MSINASLTQSAKLAVTMKHGKTVAITGISRVSTKPVMILFPVWALQKKCDRRRFVAYYSPKDFLWVSMIISNRALNKTLKNRGHANCDKGNYNQAINDHKKIYQDVCTSPDKVDEETVGGEKSNLVRAYESRGMVSYDKSEYKDAIVDFEEVLKHE